MTPWFILVVWCFWAPQGATPESLHVAPAVLQSEAACEALGQATVSQVLQTPGVTHAAYGCIQVHNPADKAT